MSYDYIILILFTVVVIVMRHFLVYLVSTKSEKSLMNAIKALKQKAKDEPEKKVEIKTLIYSVRFSNFGFALKSLSIRYGLVLFGAWLCKMWFSHLTGFIWVYIAGLIVFNIIYKKVFK